MNLEVAVSTQANADELWNRWSTLVQVRNQLGGIAQTRGEQWRNAVDSDTDPEIEDSLWNEYQDLWREFRVVSAWAELIYSVWIFRTEGADSEFLSQTDMSTSSVQIF
jgi:hypothetical protein